MTLCFHLGAIESEVTPSDAAFIREDRPSAEQDFTPNPVLFLATLFGHMTILWDMMLAFGVRQPPQYWAIAGAAILLLDSTSIAVTAVAAVEVGAKVSKWNDVGWMTLCADHGSSTGEDDTGVSNATTNADNSRRRKYGNFHGNDSTEYKGPFFEHQTLPLDISDASTLVCLCLPRPMIRSMLTVLQARCPAMDMAVLERGSWSPCLSVFGDAYSSLPLALFTGCIPLALETEERSRRQPKHQAIRKSD